MNLAEAYVPDNHPEAAFAVDMARNLIYLNNGAAVPITGFHDEDGEPVSESDLDLCDCLQVVYGPLPCGLLGVVQLRRTSARCH